VPQIDKISFFPQVFWLLIFFFIFYFIIENNLLPIIVSAQKYRKKKITKSFIIKQDLSDENKTVSRLFENFFIKAFLEINGIILKKFRKTKDFSKQTDIIIKKKFIKNSNILNQIIFQIKTKNIIK